MPSRTSLDAHSGTEDQVLHFVAFGVATWALRIWNEGISVVIAYLLSAYSYYWHQADAQAQLAFDSLLSWTRALDMDWYPTDCFKDFCRALLQAFRMQTMITSGPASRFLNFAPAFARNNSDCCDANCVIFVDTTHIHATCAA
ncbi:helicase-like protein [Trypanosoma cruzi]|nr:helicase-like protein [Trypanosoma cruzi]